MLTVRSQATRFNSTSAEVWTGALQIHDLDLSIDSGTDSEALLHGATLKLSQGRVYGLCGRNGVGKSSLLHAIADGLIDGFPRELDVLLVEQVASEQVPAETTALQHACTARARREEVAGWIAALTAALERRSSAEQAETIDLYATMKEAGSGVARVAEKDAALRSGKRGVRARQALVDREASRAAGAAQQLSDAERVNYLTRELADLTVELDLIEVPEDEEAQARKVLRGLGFSRIMMDCPYSSLSGGWRARACLARALLRAPDVLLLDEPTNSCDIDAIIWLQSYLGGLRDGACTVVVATHDQTLLNGVATDIVVMRHRQLAYYIGNYDEYMRQWTEQQAFDTRMKQGIERQKERAEGDIAQAKRAAARAGDDKRVAMLAGKQRKLEERTGLNRNAKGHRFKLNRDRAGYHNTVRADVTVDRLDVDATLALPAPSPLRHSGPLLEVEDVAFRYEGAEADVISGVTLNLELGEHVAIVGANGIGKSSLLNLISGASTPRRGSVRMHSVAVVRYFSQYAVDELRSGPSGSLTATAYLEACAPDAKRTDVRKQLAAFGLKGHAAAKVPVSSLSGGQTVRLKFAELWLSPPHLVIMDEPTNHLDIPVVDALTDALAAYPGAVLLVSHDQTFVQRLAQRTYTLEQGKLERLENGVSDYVSRVKRRLKLS